MANFPLRSGPRWLDILLVVALSVITPLVALRLRIVLSVLVGVLALVALCVAAQIAFAHGAARGRALGVTPLVALRLRIVLSVLVGVLALWRCSSPRSCGSTTGRS